MEIIRLNNITFYAYHGVRDEEKQLGQQFEVDVEIKSNLSKAIESDDLKNTLDYREIYHSIKKIVMEKKYHLIETLAGKIADEILKNLRVEEVLVRVRKPKAPVDGILGSVEVEITRKRK
jgi:dihydroneopterin aldolase